MVSAKTVINAPTGLHARPAGELVALVKSFEGSAVKLATAVRSVNAASMLSLLSLGLKAGTEVEITVEGGREAEALAAVKAFIDNLAD
ncbi:MAG: HPr family phosphocarrier protein [Bacteroidales bacterium]|nr:HPr family phosphocarrier protein [Bacteroidales bacterium]